MRTYKKLYNSSEGKLQKQLKYHCIIWFNEFSVIINLDHIKIELIPMYKRKTQKINVAQYLQNRLDNDMKTSK